MSLLVGLPALFAILYALCYQPEHKHTWVVAASTPIQARETQSVCIEYHSGETTCDQTFVLKDFLVTRMFFRCSECGTEELREVEKVEINNSTKAASETR
jgi:hypothetical protein